MVRPGSPPPRLGAVERLSLRRCGVLGPSTLSILLSVLQLAACSGNIGDAGVEGAMDGTPTAGGGKSSGGGTSSPGLAGQSPAGEVGKAACSGASQATSAGNAPMRRLTRFEYNNTVRDLLGDDHHLADSFPTDDSPGGFESNLAAPVTAIGVESYLGAAEQLGQTVDLSSMLTCSADKGDDACARDFVSKVGRRLYRRDLAKEESDRLFAVFSEKKGRSDFAGGIRLSLQVMLQSPSFLYRVELGPPDMSAADVKPLTSFEVATRLSYLLWSTAPDDELLDAGSKNALLDAQQVETQAKRMLDDARMSSTVESFYRQWLKLSRLDATSKDEGLYPTFTPAVKDSMKQETLRFMTDLFDKGDHTLGSMLQARYTFVDSALSSLYGVTMPSGGGFQRVNLPDDQRAGVLTQGGLLSATSLPDQASPIHRGKFVRENLLCQAIAPPPKGVDITPPKVDHSLPTKQRYEQHRKDPTCSGCHNLMDPIGYGFQHYDAIGKWQTKDGNFDVDAVGEITGTTDADGTFDGVVALGKKLTESTQVQECMGRQWFRFALGRTETNDEECAIAQVRDEFSASKLDLRQLLLSVTRTSAFRYRRQSN